MPGDKASINASKEEKKRNKTVCGSGRECLPNLEITKGEGHNYKHKVRKVPFPSLVQKACSLYVKLFRHVLVPSTTNYSLQISLLF